MLRLSSQRLSYRAQRLRWGMVSLFSAPVAGAFYYSHTHQTLPLGCPFLYFTGVPCPGCGMTRSFMAIAQGDFYQAVHHHVLGPILFAGSLIVVTHNLVELLTQHSIEAFHKPFFRNRQVQVAAAMLVLSYHLYRLWILSRIGELYPAILRSPLGQWLFSTHGLF